MVTKGVGLIQVDPAYQPTKKQKKHRIMLKLEKFFGIDLSKKHYKVGLMKILIELPTWMGDAVMASVAIENIINYYNSPEITLIGSSISIEVLKNHPCVKRSHVLTKKYISLIKIVRNLSDFDVFFSFRGSFRSTS